MKPILAAILLLLTQPLGSANAEGLISADSVCAAAAAAAERQYGLPAGLLLAIGKVESGRATAQGRMPWPWSINAEGADTVTDSARAAVAEVRAMQARGVRSIDTGCFQINMLYHPNAFASLEEAFDPDANARYAARFLVELHQRSNDWGAAVASYHSATPWRGEGYRQLVWRAWTGTLIDVPQPPSTGHGLASSWPGFAGVRVFVPGDAAMPATPARSPPTRSPPVRSPPARPAPARFDPARFDPAGFALARQVAVAPVAIYLASGARLPIVIRPRATP